MHDKNYFVIETNRDNSIGRGGKSIDRQQQLIQYVLLRADRSLFMPWILNSGQHKILKLLWSQRSDSVWFEFLSFKSLKKEAPDKHRSLAEVLTGAGWDWGYIGNIFSLHQWLLRVSNSAAFNCGWKWLNHGWTWKERMAGIPSSTHSEHRLNQRHLRCSSP